MSESPSSGLGRVLFIGLGVLALAGVGIALRGGDDPASPETPEAAASGPAADAPKQTKSIRAASSAPEDETPTVTREELAAAFEARDAAQAAALPTMGVPDPDDEPLELPDISWDALPESQHADAFEASLETLEDWVADIDEQYEAQLLGTDCSAPPCLVGMSFDGTSFGDDHAARAAFQSEFAEELARLRGTRPAMTMVTATPDGTTAVWMYELPQGEDGMHGDLKESAALRHQQWAKAWSSARVGRLVPPQQ